MIVRPLLTEELAVASLADHDAFPVQARLETLRRNEQRSAPVVQLYRARKED